MVLRFGTLRSKLAMLNLAVFGILLGAVCIVVLAIGENYLRRDFDDWLTSLAANIADEIDFPGAILLPESTAGTQGTPFNTLKLPGLYIQLRMADGTLVARSSSLKSTVLPLSEQAAAMQDTDQACLETLTGDPAKELLGPGRPLRMLTLYRTGLAAPPYYLQVAVSVERLNESLAHLHRLIIALMIIGMLAVGLASWLMARRALAPIGRIARDLQRLTAAHLDRRINVPTKGDELSELVVTANQMLDRLETAFRAQQQFLANAAHELKTPVAVLLGEAQVLRRHPRTLEEHEHFAADVQDEMRRFGQLIDGLLTLARSHAGFPIPLAEPVSVNEAVTDAVQGCQPLADQRGSRLVLTLASPSPGSSDAIVQGDSELLSLMVSNLIRNAIRHSPAGTLIEVEVTTHGDAATIAVRDRGPGIPADLLDRIFEPFFRVPGGDGETPGAGLGLPIAKGVAELHRGSIQALNRPGGGCEFTIHLPLVTA